MNSLLLKSIESFETQLWFKKQNLKVIQDDSVEVSNRESFEEVQIEEVQSILSKKKILLELQNNLVVYPLLDKEKQVDKCSMDIRLGNEFIVTKLPAVTHINPIDLNYELKSSEFQSRIYIPLGEPFVLHPRQFVLGSTLEYFVMPKNIMGLVLGRSSWGRLGLIIATASKIDPGFKGCITLELTNLGNIPIFLYPASRIGQLVFYYI
jgi:dCTP deaminase